MRDTKAAGTAFDMGSSVSCAAGVEPGRSPEARLDVDYAGLVERHGDVFFAGLTRVYLVNMMCDEEIRDMEAEDARIDALGQGAQPDDAYMDVFVAYNQCASQIVTPRVRCPAPLEECE